MKSLTSVSVITFVASHPHANLGSNYSFHGYRNPQSDPPKPTLLSAFWAGFGFPFSEKPKAQAPERPWVSISSRRPRLPSLLRYHYIVHWRQLEASYLSLDTLFTDLEYGRALFGGVRGGWGGCGWRPERKDAFGQ